MTLSSAFNKLTLNPFTGSNYLEWKKNLFEVLVEENKFYVLNTPKPSLQMTSSEREIRAHRDWVTADFRAKYLITTSVTNTYYDDDLDHMEYACDMMRDLNEMFKYEDLVERNKILLRILELKMMIGTSVLSHVRGMIRLFGGAISSTFPLRFQDVSDMRQVPDHQEVFVDPARDESLIFELLDLKTDVTDQGSATWFLQDMANEQDAQGTMVLEQSGVFEADGLRFRSSPAVITTAVGQMGISKGRQGREAQNHVKVYLANLRLKDVGTDVLITAYEPVLINPLSDSLDACRWRRSSEVPSQVSRCTTGTFSVPRLDSEFWRKAYHFFVLFLE